MAKKPKYYLHPDGRKIESRFVNNTVLAEDTGICLAYVGQLLNNDNADKKNTFNLKKLWERIEYHWPNKVMCTATITSSEKVN